jgi:hypothetical protein
VKLTIIVYGVGIIIVSSLIYYVIQPGIDNCNSMAGIVSTYTSQDYATGCHTLLNLRIGSLTTGLIGAGILVYGIIKKPKIN